MNFNRLIIINISWIMNWYPLLFVTLLMSFIFRDASLSNISIFFFTQYSILNLFSQNIFTIAKYKYRLTSLTCWIPSYSPGERHILCPSGYPKETNLTTLARKALGLYSLSIGFLTQLSVFFSDISYLPFPLKNNTT